MHATARIFFVAWTCLCAGLAPHLRGKVVCSGPGGHRAIELAHPDSSCSSLPDDSFASAIGESERSCVDVPLADPDVLRPQREPGIPQVDLLSSISWLTSILSGQHCD